MATRSYMGLNVSKDRLDVAVLGERQEQQVSNTEGGIVQLVKHIAIHGDGGILYRSTVRGFDVASPLT